MRGVMVKRGQEFCIAKRASKCGGLEIAYYQPSHLYLDLNAYPRTIMYYESDFNHNLSKYLTSQQSASL